MNEAFKKMLMKKKGSQEDSMSKDKKDARGSVLDDLMGNMNSRDGKKLSMKKVTVAAPTKEALKEGLDKAKEIVGHEPMMEGSPEEEEATETPEEESQEDESSEEPEESEEDDHSDKTPEQMMEEIKKLKAALAAKA